MTGDPYPRPCVEICSNAWNDPTQPAWIDISDRVADDTDEPGWEVTEGRVNALDTAEPGRLRLALRNNDDRFTIGNPSSPYYPWWGQSARIRLYESYGPERFDLFDGFVQWPTLTTHVVGAHQLCSISAVDRLGWLQSAPQFVSTLGAHILSAGGSTLKAYWPLSDPNSPFTSVVSQSFPARTEGLLFDFAGTGAQTGSASHLPASLAGPPGEDVSFAEYDVIVENIGGLLRASRSILTRSRIPAGALTLAAGQVMTVVAWVYSDWRAVDSESDPINIVFTDPAVGSVTLVKQDGLNATWLAEVSPGALSGSLAGPIAASSRWTLVALRYGFTPDVFEMWVDDTRLIGSLSGTAPTSTVITDVFMPYRSFAGAVAHVQFYIGADSDWDFTDFAEQRQHGLEGLEGQLTGERVRTIAGYAGLPPGLVKADKGTVRMSRASLAGKTPLTALREAETTEQGRLMCHGENVVFWDRRRSRDI